MICGRLANNAEYRGLWAALLLLAAPAWAQAAGRAGTDSLTPATSILFVGNSFTFGHGSPVRMYRADTVTDLNAEGVGGVPALFKAFAVEAGLRYSVYLETHPGVGLNWHLQHERARLNSRAWDAVVLQSFSTLDARHPGDPAGLVQEVRLFAALLREKNPTVTIRLVATWPRPDQTRLRGGPWFEKPLAAMTHDLRTGADLAVAGTPGITGVIPVGDAFMRAIRAGVADADPFDGIDAGMVDLWGIDRYHASTYGYYLEALLDFGSVTGRDPRSLGSHECAAADLNLAPDVVAGLEQVAFEELAAQGLTLAGAALPADPGTPIGAAAEAGKCAH